MSISKAQAKALSNGFLDNLGEGKEGLIPRETLSELYVLAGDFIDYAQQELNKSNSNASGKLSESLAIINPTEKSIDVEMNDYGWFVNDGVKGTKSGAGKYAFKNDGASRKMVNEIQKWIKRGGLKSKNTNAKKSIYAQEKKNASLSELNKGRAVAYAVARSIKQRGIKATGFIDKAGERLNKEVTGRLGEAFRIDIINSLPDKLN